MIETVLVAVDDSPLAESAVAYAAEVFADADLEAVHVADVEYDMNYDMEEVERASLDGLEGAGDELAQSVFATVREVLADRDVDASATLLVGDPGDRLVEYAAERNVDQIVMGTHARAGLSRHLIGSVAEQVARRTDAPTTLVK
ncbi:universal stress protein [Haloparvum sedimenti]|uniref:universal stress protein n=1 Tax=Haloparvum sedimenti TaxID=1678448 RepID=UPI00071E6FB6|nr:universal stress protein [Haloparvum sedimenti]